MGHVDNFDNADVVGMTREYVRSVRMGNLVLCNDGKEVIETLLQFDMSSMNRPAQEVCMILMNLTLMHTGRGGIPGTSSGQPQMAGRRPSHRLNQLQTSIKTKVKLPHSKAAL